MRRHGWLKIIQKIRKNGILMILFIVKNIQLFFRAYYKNSYMIQRNEGKKRKSFFSAVLGGGQGAGNEAAPSSVKSPGHYNNVPTSASASTLETKKNNISTLISGNRTRTFQPDTASNCPNNPGEKSCIVKVCAGFVKS